MPKRKTDPERLAMADQLKRTGHLMVEARPGETMEQVRARVHGLRPLLGEGDYRITTVVEPPLGVIAILSRRNARTIMAWTINRAVQETGGDDSEGTSPALCPQCRLSERGRVAEIKLIRAQPASIRRKTYTYGSTEDYGPEFYFAMCARGHVIFPRWSADTPVEVYERLATSLAR